MGGYAAYAPNPTYPLPPINTTSPPPNEYPHMTVMPEDTPLERVIGRFYVTYEHHWLPWRRKWLVYEMCPDLTFKTYGTPFKSKLQAQNVAADMFWLVSRSTHASVQPSADKVPA